ncbi:MAG: FISUMP domain-containing protein [Bacteroidales bacterium]
MSTFIRFYVLMGILFSFSQVEAQNCSNITGQGTYLNAVASPLSGVTVQLLTSEGDLLQTVTTDGQGYFSFCQPAPGDYKITLLSSNPVGGINATDALIALQHYVGQVVLTGLPLQAADVNGNGYINATNALQILKHFVGYITTFPAGDWVFETTTFQVAEGETVNLQIKGICYGDLDASFFIPPCTPMPTPANAGPDQNPGTTTITLEGNEPEFGTGQWSIYLGEGGILEDPGNPFSTFTGVAGNNYMLVWTITTVCASSSDTVLILFTSGGDGGPCPGIPDFEYEGQTYNTVKIGDQCWMKENLNVGTMILLATNSSNNGIIEKYCFNNDESYCLTYGAYYKWVELMQYIEVEGSQGICPVGWHVPTMAEWCTLATHLDPATICGVEGADSEIAGGMMKETGDAHWNSPNSGATNESGFTALGSGYRFFYGVSVGLKVSTYLWSSSQSPLQNMAITHALTYDSAGLTGLFKGKDSEAYSVRCIKNN